MMWIGIGLLLFAANSIAFFLLGKNYGLWLAEQAAKEAFFGPIIEGGEDQ